MNTLSPPALSLWAGELLALPKVLAAPLRKPVIAEPFGEGRGAMVIPGLLSNDAATAVLRGSLDQAGFVAQGWGEKATVRVGNDVLLRAAQTLEKLVDQTGRKAVLIGWSLGGLYARTLAHRMPDKIDLLITLGSPFSGDRRANNAWRVYEWLNDHSVDASPFEEDFSIKPPMPTIAVWSPRDGIIACPCAAGEIEQSDDRICLAYRHLELASSKRAVAELLGVVKAALDNGATKIGEANANPAQ